MRARRTQFCCLFKFRADFCQNDLIRKGPDEAVFSRCEIFFNYHAFDDHFRDYVFS